jgi:glyoxalase-like protein
MDRQLPLGDEIFLDHVAHFVRDAQAASRGLARAGFAPTSLSVQTNPDPGGGPPLPTGTGNVTAMLARGYVEALFKTADTPLAHEFETAITRHEGIHLVAFAVADAATAHRRLADRGFQVRPLAEMQRPVDAGGKPGTAAFTVARLETGEMPEGRMQILTHRTEDMVWQPRWLDHPNGALGLSCVTIAVADVGEAVARFARFTGRAARLSRFGRAIDLDRGCLHVVSAEGFAQMAPQIPIPSLPFIGAYGIAVRSCATVETLLHRNGLAAHRQDRILVVPFPHELGHGAWLFADNASATDRAP